MANEHLDARLQKVAELVISKMEKMRNTNQESPWVNLGCSNPQNITGREYSGSNALFLALETDEKRYKSPTYLTFMQAKDEGVMVKKGEKSFPVFYHDMIIKDKEGKKVSPADFKLMTPEGQSQCEVRSFAKTYDVFNIDQTNMPELQPEKYASILKGRSELTEKNYHHDLLSNMEDKQTWKCPIQHGGNEAYYNTSKDFIRLPLKDTFKTQESYFGVMLHEMVHSTAHPQRLDRPLAPQNADLKSYAREELVAELGSALAGVKLGVQKEISDHNISYIKHWTEAAREDSRFVYKAVVDAAKAANYTCEHLGIKSELSQKVAEAKGMENKESMNIGQKLLDFNKQLEAKKVPSLQKSKGISL